ncbi:hypothetical protein PIB30_008753 [Stylosanthes scabra]|uniref:Uncharacterized protein n=1 Tax=Stylosanthes scabra TaxID=79078 RepID=A0ABU6W5L2_9FABA|nr:hypothetical protein [Stylosanthes scabra]
MAARIRFTMFATEKERSEFEVKAFLMERIALVLIATVTASIAKQCPCAHIIYDAHTWLFFSLVLITYTMGPAFWLYTAVTGGKVSPWIATTLFLSERLFLIACIPAAVPKGSIFVNPTSFMFYLSLAANLAYFLSFMDRILGAINNCFGESYSNFGEREKEHYNGNDHDHVIEEDEDEEWVNGEDEEEEEEWVSSDEEEEEEEWVSNKMNKKCSKCEEMLAERELECQKLEKCYTKLIELEDAVKVAMKKQQEKEEIYKKENNKLEGEIQISNQEIKELNEEIEQLSMSKEEAQDLYEKEKNKWEEEKAQLEAKGNININRYRQLLMSNNMMNKECCSNFQVRGVVGRT